MYLVNPEKPNKLLYQMGLQGFLRQNKNMRKKTQLPKDGKIN